MFEGEHIVHSGDKVGESRHQVATERRGGLLVQVGFLTQSFNNSTDGVAVNNTLLVDWNTSDDVLLVIWGDNSDSNSDTWDEGLAGWSGDSNGDSENAELEWEPRIGKQDNLVATKTIT